MKTVPFGTSELKVPNVVAGMMRIAGDTDEQIRSSYMASREAGIDFFDHADLYGFNHPGGGFHLCERRFAEALRLSPSEREQIVLQTKTSIVDDPWGYDQSYEHRRVLAVIATKWQAISLSASPQTCRSLL